MRDDTETLVHWSIYIRGCEFPNSRNGIVRHCEDHDAPEAFIRLLLDLPERTYHTAADVGRELM